MFLASRIKVLDTLVGVSVDSIPVTILKSTICHMSVFYKALSKCCAVGTLVTCFVFFMFAGGVSLTDVLCKRL